MCPHHRRRSPTIVDSFLRSISLNSQFLKFFAAAGQEMTELLRSSIFSKQLSFSNKSSSCLMSERNETSVIEEMRFFRKVLQRR
jgi:hypothetical protein